MKLSICEIMTLVCILAIGFLTVAPFLQQDAAADADEYDCVAYEVRSFAYGPLGHLIVSATPRNTSHYGYYHNPGSSTTAYEHRQNWPSGHPHIKHITQVLGTIWVP